MKVRSWFLKRQRTLVNVLLTSKLMKMLGKQLNIISELWKMTKFTEKKKTNKQTKKTEHHLSRRYKSKTEESVIFWIGVILIFPPSWALWLGNPKKNLAVQLTEKTALLWALVKTPLAPLQNTFVLFWFFFFLILEASRKNSISIMHWQFDLIQYSAQEKQKQKPTYRVSPKTVETSWNNSAL